MTSDGAFLICSSWSGLVQIWDMKAHEISKSLPHPEGVSEVALSPNGKWLATGCDDGLTRVYDFSLGECLHIMPYNSRGLVFSQDGKYLLGGRNDRTVRFWNTETFEIVEEYAFPEEKIHVIAMAPQGVRTVEVEEASQEMSEEDVSEQVAERNFPPRKMVDLMNAPGDKKRIRSLGTVHEKAYLMAAGGYTGDIVVWNLKTRKGVQYLKGHHGYVVDICFSPDGKKLASCGTDETVRIWDMKSGRELGCWQGHTRRVNSVRYSPDGKKVVTGGEDGVMRIWDTRSGKVLGVFPQQKAIRAIAMTPNEKLLLTGDVAGDVVIYDAKTGKRIRTFKANPDAITSMVVTQDSRTLFSCGRDGTFHSWNLATGKFQGNIPHSQGEIRVALSGDGKWIATATERHIVRIFNVATGKLYNSIPYHCRGLALTFDGKYILGGRHNYTVKMWETETGKLEHDFNYRGSPLNVVALTSVEVDLSEDVSEEASADKEKLASIPEKERMISLSLDCSMRQWNEKKGTLQETISASDELYTIAYDKPHHRMAVAGKDTMIRMLDLKTLEIQKTFRGYESAVFSVAISPQGKWLASGGADGSLYIWDTEDGEVPVAILKGHKNGVNALVFYSDTILLSAGTDKVIRAWNLKTEKCVRMMTGHADAILTLALSPDKTILLSGGLDNSVRLWNPKTGKQLKKLSGHTDEVSTLAFSPDGKVFISGSWDNTIKIWDTVTREEKGTLNEHTEPLYCVCFTPDGKRIVSGSMDNTILLWDAESQQRIQTFQGHEGCVTSLLIYEE